MQPIYLENDLITLQPVSAADLSTSSALAYDVHALLSDPLTIKYLPEKKLSTQSHAEGWLYRSLLNLHCGRTITHLIRLKCSNKLIGVLDVIPSQVAAEHYSLNNYPVFVEFYLSPEAQGRLVMSALLPQVIAVLQANGTKELAAVVNRKNIAASKVLIKSGFVRMQQFDIEKDLYALSA
jgi:GNAT superfamily N-acetyltransferase